MQQNKLHFSRAYKKAVFLLFDLLALPVCCWLSFALRYGDWTAQNFSHWPAYFLAPLIAIPIFIRFGLYRAVIRYIGYKAQWTIVKAVTLMLLIWAVCTYLLGLEQNTPRSVILIFWFIAIFAVGGSRMIARWIILYQFPGGVKKAGAHAERVLIYGAGMSGRQLATALGYSAEFSTIAFVDDDNSLAGLDIKGLRVFKNSEIEYLIERYDVDAVLLAMPSASRTRRKEIVDQLASYHVRVLTLPGLADIAGGKVSIEDVREVDIGDLLGRDEVQPDQYLLDACIKNQGVLVTGAGGSIGSELCRQITNQEPSVLVLFEQSEYHLYELHRELSGVLNHSIELIPVIGSALDQKHLERVMRLYGISTVYHAAAYKHVPIVEANMLVGIRNNLFGTLSAAKASMAVGVSNFVLISTDKAVRPTNVMGASKRFAELVLQALSGKDENCTRFAIVRFGNVLGSSGSVIPLFRSQIKEGGPVTVTHPDITRYFMTIPEAASLVIQAGSIGASGDVFVLDMGKPVKIKNLAKQMINLTGLSVRDAKNPDGDIEIVYTGLRDGEKLYEELLIGDNVYQTKHPMIMRAQEVMIHWGELEAILGELALKLDSYDYEGVRGLLLAHVNGYSPNHEIRDYVYAKEQSSMINSQ